MNEMFLLSLGRYRDAGGYSWRCFRGVDDPNMVYAVRDDQQLSWSGPFDFFRAVFTQFPEIPTKPKR